MENLKGRYIELLQEKLDALNYMREATLGQVFTGDETLVESEAEAFIALYEKRGNVLSRVEKIDDALELLDPLDAEDLEDTAFQSQVVGLRQKMVELARDMVNLDKANMDVYKKISAYVKNNMKQARQGLDLIQGYDDYLDANEGHFLDKKKM
ncbi:MAG: hypothetical protein LBE55_02850 [Clostridiales bacterium]|jgi:hypothetical protein|nr:hypothetical protein [Clostridiales bacterium]